MTRTLNQRRSVRGLRSVVQSHNASSLFLGSVHHPKPRRFMTPFQQLMVLSSIGGFESLRVRPSASPKRWDRETRRQDSGARTGV
jgi:hypothetical protein